MMNQSIKIELIGETERGDLFRLLEPLEFEWRGKSFTVPAGFESDGCSVPRFLWSSVSPRIDNRTLRGAIGHDWLYRTHPEGWTKAEADGMFYDIIREDGLSWWKSQKAYWGVRLFGGDSWHQGGRVTTKYTILRRPGGAMEDKMEDKLTGLPPSSPSGTMEDKMEDKSPGQGGE